MSSFSFVVLDVHGGLENLQYFGKTNSSKSYHKKLHLTRTVAYFRGLYGSLPLSKCLMLNAFYTK